MSDEQIRDEGLYRFAELARGFESLRIGGQRLCSLAEHLVALAFRDLPYAGIGGLVVPQLGEEAGRELLFSISNSPKDSEVLKMAQTLAASFWESGAIDNISRVLFPSSANMPLQCIVLGISEGFDRPIGHFWAAVHPDNEKPATSRLEYVTKYFATTVRAEKACNAVELLSDATSITRSTFEETSQVIAKACREALSAETVLVWMADRVKERLRTIATSDAKGSRLRADMDFGQGIAGKCVKEGVSFMIDDLLDEAELRKQKVLVYNPQLVKDRGWHSAMFVPLDIGGQAGGVMAAYAIRHRGFSLIDKHILLAFANRLSASLANFERIRQLTEMERSIESEAPAIEAGRLAMENVHDSVNSLTFAQDSLTRIAAALIGVRHHPLYAEITTARELVTSAKKGISALTNRIKFQKIIPSRTPLKELLEQAIAKIAQQAQDQRINVTLKCPSDLVLHIDKDKLQRVFVNLLENAIWFLERDSKGEQSTVDIHVTTEPGPVVITFRDNGPGIAPYDLRKIFDYFFTTKGDRGMGFGLAIAKRILVGHGGTIKVRSEWGYWTEIIMELPETLRMEA